MPPDQQILIFAGKQLENWADGEFSTFGEDRDGELYLAMHGAGKIMKISELCSPFKISGTTTDETCAGDKNGSIVLNVENPAGGNVAFSWSGGGGSTSLTGLAAGPQHPPAHSRQQAYGQNCPTARQSQHFRASVQS